MHDRGAGGRRITADRPSCIGFSVLIVFACRDSGPDNKYGPNPKNATAGYAA